MSDEIEAIAALADPVRRRLYDLVAAAPEPVGREEAAAGAGVPAHSARFHLDRLVEDGLLEVEFRRLTGRTGPGAGRPAKLYRRSTREVAVSVPPRSYDLVGSILAHAVARSLQGEELAGALGGAARERGRAVATAYDAAPGTELERTAGVLAGEGFEPSLDGGDLCLRNCPFDALAREHTALVCGVNLDFVRGVVEGLGCHGATPRLDPHEDRCCVVVSGS
jgi:predicted ArsR family transcriptional regulator